MEQGGGDLLLVREGGRGTVHTSFTVGSTVELKLAHNRNSKRTYVRTKAGARTMINIKYSNVQLIIQSHGGNIQLFILEYISLTIN